MNRKFKDFLFYIGSIFLVLSAVFYTAGWDFIPYVYAVSGAGVAVAFLTNPYRGDNIRIKRLNIQQAIAALLLPVSSCLMFKKMNEWIICLLISAVLQMYVIFIREYEEKKKQ
jgi:VIT1/CCC1 family predicted Fe2+/Mn2+ transporter